MERAGYSILSDDGRNPSTILTGGEGRTGIAVDVSAMETISIRSLPHSDTTRSGAGHATIDSVDMISNATRVSDFRHPADGTASPFEHKAVGTSYSTYSTKFENFHES